MASNPYSPPTSSVSDPETRSHHVSTFRALVSASLVSYIAAAALALGEAGPVADLAAQMGYGGGILPPTIQFIISWTQIAATVACTIGLLFFSKLARLGLLLVLVSAIPIAAISGIVATSPFSSAVWGAHSLLFMFMFGMAYFHPPIRKHFETNGANN